MLPHPVDLNILLQRSRFNYLWENYDQTKRQTDILYLKNSCSRNNKTFFSICNKFALETHYIPKTKRNRLTKRSWYTINQQLGTGDGQRKFKRGLPPYLKRNIRFPTRIEQMKALRWKVN